MKKMATILLFAFLAQHTWAQCPDIALMSNQGQCMSVAWFFDLPDTLPDTIESEGNLYLYVDGIGISVAEAALYTMDRSITDPLECATDFELMSGTMTTMGETCSYSGGLLPITLISFNAVQQGARIEITWETSFEYNSEMFEVQRSEGDGVWTVIAEVKGRGQYDGISTYSAYDQWPYIGVNYYRLIAIDNEGNTEVSAVAQVTYQPTAVVYPNPASRWLMITSDFRMFDSAGRLVSSGTAQQLDVSDFTPGLYVVLVHGTAYRVAIQ